MFQAVPDNSAAVHFALLVEALRPLSSSKPLVLCALVLNQEDNPLAVFGHHRDHRVSAAFIAFSIAEHRRYAAFCNARLLARFSFAFKEVFIHRMKQESQRFDDNLPIVGNNRHKQDIV